MLGDLYEFSVASEPATGPWSVIHHLSASSLAMWLRCPEQGRQRYVLGKKERPGEALVVGSAVHVSMKRNLTQKVQSFQDLPVSEMDEAFMDLDWAETVNSQAEYASQDVAWDEGEEAARERARRMALAYHKGVAPRIQPLSAEQEVRVDFGLPVPLIGFCDAVTEEVVIDLKTGKQAAKSIKPEWRLQAHAYSAMLDKPVHFHTAAALKTKINIFTPLEEPELAIAPEASQREELVRTLRFVATQIDSYWTTFGPDQPWPTLGQFRTLYNGIACRFCAYQQDCPAWKGAL